MSETRSIHELLERAVRDHSPTTADPERAVLARARRDRRRSVLLTAAATMAVVLGGAGVLTVVDTQTRGTGPAAGPGEGLNGGWFSYHPTSPEDIARADAEALRRAAEDAAATGYAEESGLVVALLAEPLVNAPPGWTESDETVSTSNFGCLSTASVVYRATYSMPALSGTQRPCEGDLLSPYLWTTAGVPLPHPSRPVHQQLLAEGVPIWVQNGTDPTGNPVIDVHFPGSGVLVRAAGVSLDELLGYLIAPEPVSAPLEWYVRPPGDNDDIEGVVTVARGQQAVPVAGQADLLELDEALRRLPQTGTECVLSADQWRLDVKQGRGGMRTNHIVIDDLAGCATVVSSMGGIGQATPEFLLLLERLIDS